MNFSPKPESAISMAWSVTQLDYMRALDDILVETPIEDWQTYLKWQVIDTKAAQLNSAMTSKI